MTERQQTATGPGDNDLPALLAKMQDLEEEVRELTVESRRTGEALRTSEERYRALHETMPVAALVHVEGVIALVNAEAVRTLGAVTPDDLVGRPIWDIIHSDYRDIIESRIARASAHGERGPLMIQRLVRLDGAVIIVEAAIAPIGFMDRPAIQVVFRDITARIGAELALREKEQRFRQFAENIDSVIWLTDGAYADGPLLYLNTAAERVWGFPLDHDRGLVRTYLDHVHVEDRAWVTGRFAGHDFRGNGLLMVEHRSCAPDGRVHWLRTRIHPVEDGQGTVVRLAGISENITELREALANREDAVRMAERSMRLASLGTLAAGISHEINQPLTALKVALDGALLLHEMGRDIGGDRLMEVIGDCAKQAARIDGIVRHMRSLVSHDTRTALTPTDVNRVIADALTLVESRLVNHDITVVTDLATGLPPVSAVPGQLEQVVINLALNGMNALDSVERPEKRIVLASRPDGGTVEMTVSDNGPGIPPGTLPHIFDPFFTTHQDTSGMGMGLSIVNSIVTAFNGSITVKNDMGGGAVFTVRLPVHDGQGGIDEDTDR